MYFNLISSLDVSNLNFSVVLGSSYDPSVGLSEAPDGYGFKSDGDGYYDIAIDFGNNLGSDGSVTFDITGISGLIATDFESLSTDGGGEGDYDAAAHIMGITGPGGSTWIDPSLGPQTLPVPEPAPVAILAMGIGLIYFAPWWRRVKA